MLISSNKLVAPPTMNLLKPAQKAAAEAKPLRDSVTLSAAALSRTTGGSPTGEEAQAGRATLLKRMFGIDDVDAADPPVWTSAANLTTGRVAYFLNADDRKMLANAYEVAEQRGIDPLAVDNLVVDLGMYRMGANTGNSPDTTGQLSYPDGRPVISVFSPEREAAARELLSSKAMDDTKIDSGFLQFVTNPGRYSRPAVDFGVLRELMVASSASNSDGGSKSGISFADRDARIELAKVVEASAPQFASNSTEKLSGIDGKAIMMSRLFGQSRSDAVTGVANRPSFTNFLSDDDKDLLGGLYAVAKANGADLAEIDKMANALGAVRKAESLMKLQNAMAPDLSQLLLLDAKAPEQHAFEAGMFAGLSRSSK
jgi:hypothetical protein